MAITLDQPKDELYGSPTSLDAHLNVVYTRDAGAFRIR
jgi:hypothetical protein